MGKGQSPKGFKKTCVLFVFDVKHDGRNEARLIDYVNVTDVPLCAFYSGVVSLDQ